MVKTFGLEDMNLICTPAATGVVLGLANCPTSAEKSLSMQNIPYQNAISTLNHCIIMTCLDISLTVQKVAQFAANPRHKH